MTDKGRPIRIHFPNRTPIWLARAVMIGICCSLNLWGRIRRKS